MPNLKLLSKLNSKYKTHEDALESWDIDLMVDYLDPKRDITKVFSFSESKIIDHIKFFKEREKASVVLLFIDITSFSSAVEGKSSNDLASFLDTYYSNVIPIVSNYGGVIEKIMGDGIICVFGKPFIELDVDKLHDRAEECAKDIICELKGTEHECKIALHYGEIMYYQTPLDEYYEFTMIGNALTELFRLESVSHTNSINYYENTFYHKYLIANVSILDDLWNLCNNISVDLNGVIYKSRAYIENKS